MTFWSILGAIAATALTSGSVAALVTHFLSSDRERRNLLRQKAEDLYVSIEALENTWSIGMIALNRLVIGSIDYNQYHDSVIQKNAQIDGSINRRVEMLARIYFPSAELKMDAVFDSMDQINTLSALHKAAYLEGLAEEFRWGRDFAPKVEHASACFKQFKAAVVRCAQSSFTPLRRRV